MGQENSQVSPYPPWIKTLLFALQISFVLVLLVVWISSKSLQESKSLWILFFYSFPSEFLIATVPHEPVLLYFGKFYHPLTVALVAIPSTLLTEMLNYSTFKYITDLRVFSRLSEKRVIQNTVDFFNKAPFLTLWIVGITPIPFYPLRFLVVLARYPRVKYITAVFLSRFPRFALFAYVGYAVPIPDYLLIVLFIALIAIANITIFRSIKGKKRKEKTDAA
jgi:membrane protein YqaA with SNARE-associated domain